MIKPINNKIVLQKVSEEKITSSGIILASKGDEKVSVFEVLAVCDDSYIGVSVGDKVICSEYAGFDYEEKGKAYKLIDEDSILAIYEDHSRFYED